MNIFDFESEVYTTVARHVSVHDWNFIFFQEIVELKVDVLKLTTGKACEDKDSVLFQLFTLLQEWIVLKLIIYDYYTFFLLGKLI